MTFTFNTIQEAIRKGSRLKELNRNAIVFVVYDKKAKQYDALTDQQLNRLYRHQEAATAGWHIIIKCEL